MYKLLLAEGGLSDETSDESPLSSPTSSESDGERHRLDRHLKNSVGSIHTAARSSNMSNPDITGRALVTGRAALDSSMTSAAAASAGAMPGSAGKEPGSAGGGPGSAGVAGGSVGGARGSAGAGLGSGGAGHGSAAAAASPHGFLGHDTSVPPAWAPKFGGATYTKAGAGPGSAGRDAQHCDPHTGRRRDCSDLDDDGGGRVDCHCSRFQREE